MAINASTGEVFSGYGRPSQFEHKVTYGVKSIPEAARDVNVLREVDVCVVGGGPGGIAAAVSAARGGAKTLLIERYGHLDVLFPKAFLLKMLKREIIERYAEREKHAVRPLEDVPQERLKDDWVFEDGVLDRALAEDVLMEAKRLPRDTYRIFVLYYGYELTISEIAKELGMGAEAVKSRLFRGRNAIRQYLTAEDADSESGR